MNTHPLLDESLRRDIDQIQCKVVEMAGLSELALKASVQALTGRNRQQAYSVILRDQHIDELETEIDRLCLEFMVRHQPVSQQLRFIFSTLQINRELERIGDYAESIARQVLVVSKLEPQPPPEKFVELGDLAIHMLRDAVQSFQQKDASLAQRTMAIEERANVLRNSINADLRELSQTGRLPAESLTPLQTVARRLEGVTDQAKNLCEDVLYICTGEFVRHKGADEYRILFVDPSNGALSQMAEGIAAAAHRERFVFSSAGMTPQPVDARVVKFMAAKAVDISKQSSKSLEQVPEWQHYQVIVCFGGKVRDAISPPASGKTVFFNWPIKDPLLETGSAAATNAAFEEAYQSLNAHIRELLGAILQEPQNTSKP